MGLQEHLQKSFHSFKYKQRIFEYMRRLVIFCTILFEKTIARCAYIWVQKNNNNNNKNKHHTLFIVNKSYSLFFELF